jgi:hypothetical protein
MAQIQQQLNICRGKICRIYVTSRGFLHKHVVVGVVGR